MGRPLEGLKVVDLSTFVAAPVCCRLLADMGADVIKIERPEGDMWRATSISYVPAHFSVDENPVFDIYNAGKRFIALDMKTDEGQKIFRDLLKDADIFVTNNRDNALKRLHATYDDLKDEFPRLIYAQVTGFGGKGPDAAIPAFDTTAFWSKTGFMMDMAVVGDDGSYQPTYPPSGIGDTVTAYLLLSQINAALYQRTFTGKGQRVEACLYHCGIFTMGTMEITNQKPWGRKFPTDRASHSLPGGYYKCKDGDYIFIATGMVTKIIEQMTRAIGRPELKDDPMFANAKVRWENRYEIYRIFREAFLTKTSDEWLQIAKEIDFAMTKYAHFGDVFEDEQAIANGFVEDVTFRNGVTDGMPRSPLHMDSIPELHTVPADYCGAHSAEIVKELGYSDEEVNAMLEKGVIKQA